MNYDDNAIGPIGDADRDLLMSVARYFHQPAVLEFGGADGHSAQAWIDAGASHVTSVDLLPAPNQIADVERVQCDQRAFRPTREYDIIFFDASHDLAANIQTLANVQDSLTPGGVLVIHDTGIWAKDAMTDAHKAFQGLDVPEGKIHQPGEVLFVLWLRKNGWQCVELASRSALRHGLTICQRP